jgi:predicted unusual protein kinase regulating ubiquinone biosynthesis (AarF/ABC1/UbiB family)
MAPNVADLLAAMPADDQSPEAPPALDDLDRVLSDRPVPTGALHRFWRLGGLQARIGLAYLVYWTRSFFQAADTREKSRMETHLAAAVRLLETMGYLRGAIMKIGQAAANFPNLVPDEFTDTLSRLHFEAPPMHYALIREFVHNELGGDPEELFDSFETTAFAAASLGQVHRARLKSGEPVAVKIQYPGIARTIRSDFRNLHAVLFPFRLSRDWENLKSQFEEIQRIFELETDYENEARMLVRSRALFQEDDRIVIPRPIEQFSTRRILTMEFVDGLNMYQFLDTNPSQELRNHYGSLMSRSACRMIYAGRMQYADPHPGNYLFMEGDRLGIVDFGCMREFNDREWEYLRLACEASNDGSRKAIIEHILRGTDFDENEVTNSEMMELMIAYCRWMWRPLVEPGTFDYRDPDVMREGIDIMQKFARLARPRQKAVNVFIQRSTLAGWGLQHRLGSQVNVYEIANEEVRATGWHTFGVR